MKLINAEDYIIQTFQENNIIGLGEGEHQLENSHQFFYKMLDNRKIQNTVNIVIIEFANARHQDTLDKYIFGEEVSFDELKKTWRDSTQCIGLFGESRIYLELLQKIRNVNFNLESSKKIRVLAGDPSIDWASIRSLKDYLAINMERDSFAAGLAIEHGISRSMKVLLIYAEAHLTKKTDVGREDFPTITDTVNIKYPSAMRVIAVLDPKDFHLSRETRNWPLYSVVELDVEEIGSLPAKNYFTKIFDDDGQVVMFKGCKVKEIFDAFLVTTRTPRA